MTEKRKDPRVPLKLKVRLKRGSFEGYYYTANISRGGIFVETEEPFPIDEPVEIELYLSEEHRITCHGKVVWSSPAGVNTNYLPGMGIKFEDISLEDREILGRFLGEIIAKEQEVDEDFLYDLQKRIVLTSDDIFDTSAEAIVLFGGEGIKEGQSFMKEVLANSSPSFKKYYEILEGVIGIGRAVMIPYEGKFRSFYVILVGIQRSDGLNDEGILREVMVSALRMAKEQAFPAIAVPVFFLLELGYPIALVSKICFGSVYGFLRKEIFPRKVFFYTNYNNFADFLAFQKIAKEIFSN